MVVTFFMLEVLKKRSVAPIVKSLNIFYFIIVYSKYRRMCSIGSKEPLSSELNIMVKIGLE